MQFQLFQSLGIQGHFGMSELRQVQRRFGQDADVMQAFMQLVSAYVLCHCIMHSSHCGTFMEPAAVMYTTVTYLMSNKFYCSCDMEASVRMIHPHSMNESETLRIMEYGER